ncbi:MAG TPA: hypothetical protein VL173_06260 [Vicinamibacterales bacterium]|nr:hypothetical protein [Vicinamibacterales bacterium]
MAERGPERLPRLTYVVAVAWLALHLPFLAPSLEDIDSINFALGLHHFDPGLHQPHPPGYPVFIAAGRIALALIHLFAPGLAYMRADALALAIWSAIGGTIAIIAIGVLFREVTGDGAEASETGLCGAAIVAATPLVWLTGLRPMSDMLGLGLALAGQALSLRAMRDPRGLVWAAVAVGVALGTRAQTWPLTLPLFAYALVVHRRQRGPLLRAAAVFLVVCLAWAVPLLVASGGVGGYVHALGNQADEDFSWVNMLWAHPAPKAIAFALYDSVVLPFGSVTLAAVVLTIAIAGTIWLFLFDRRALVLLAMAFVPYAVFHLLFQETGNLRYATPLVPAMVYPAARLLVVPVRHAGRHTARMASGVLVVALLWVALPATGAYASEAHPAFRAIADMTSMVERAGSQPAAVFAHYALRRPLQAAPTMLPIVEPRRTYEWLALEDYWLKGGRDVVWFLADPSRTDLALIDPQVRVAPVEYRWRMAADPAFMGSRPMAADWYRFNAPGWFAGEGWELTPETAGVARAAGKRLPQHPISAWVRRRSDPLQAIVAGRDLGRATDPPSIFEMAIDGQVVDTWRLDPAKDGINFFHVVSLPHGIPAGTGNYAALTITARAEPAGVRTPDVAVEQFDLQDLKTVMFGFGEGWQEAEYDNARGLAWRWTGDKATLRIFAPGGVRISLRGESPLKYFDAPPTVRMRAGDRELAVLQTFHRGEDFIWDVTVPGDALAASGGRVTIETDKVYLPGQAEGTTDARRLGLRVFEVRVE